MEKKDVLKNLKKIETEVESIKANRRNRAYISISKHIDSIGLVSEIETLRELVDAKIIIEKALKSSDEENIMKDLGLTDSEMNAVTSKTEKRFLGLTKREWNDDFNTKLDELRESEKIASLEKAKGILTKHLSDKDMFKMDTAGIDELVSGL